MAPMNVPRLFHSLLSGSSVSGITYAATAEMPKATEPAKLSQVLHQPRTSGSQSPPACRVAETARALLRRNMMDP